MVEISLYIYIYIYIYILLDKMLIHSSLKETKTVTPNLDITEI